MTPLGVVFILASIWSLIVSPKSLPWILAASAPFAATSAITVGDNGLPPFYVVGAAATAISCLRICRRTADGRPGLGWLSAFVWWTLLLTAFAPSFFDGIPVLIPRLGIDSQIEAPGALAYSPSNLAQCFYLIIGAGIVHYLATHPSKISPTIVGLGFAVGTLVSSVILLMTIAGISWPSWVFDNYPGLAYGPAGLDGFGRFRGIFPEPSYLAVFSIPAVAFFLFSAWRVSRWSRAVYLILAALAGVNISLSSSTTATLGALALAGLVLAVGIWRFFSGKVKVRPSIVLMFLGLCIVLAMISSSLVETLNESLTEKANGSSFANRSESDAFSMSLMLDTFGFGVGLGGNRPSSMFAMLLSNVGIIGTFLFLSLIFSALRAALTSFAWTPAVWALVGLLITKGFAEPALSTPMLWLCIGVAFAARQAASGTKVIKGPCTTSLRL